MASPAQDAEGQAKHQDAEPDTTVCSKCEGPVPWEEVDPHADEANGDICSECGHFYGTPPYEGECEETLLTDYCMARDWGRAMKRVTYVPKEAHHPGYNNCPALHWAIYYTAPFELIRALVEAFPRGVSLGSSIGCPLWMAIKGEPLSERLLEIVQLMVNADNDSIRTVPDEGYMESTLGSISRKYAKVLLAVSKRPETESMESVLAYSNGESLPSGLINLAFQLNSSLVKAEYYGSVNGGQRLVHACAGCRDPFFLPKGILSLALRFYPEQFLEVDEHGNLPLHIALSTVNRDKKDYHGHVFGGDEDSEYEEELCNIFLEAVCKHCFDIEEYLEHECSHDVRGEKFEGCDCDNGDEEDDYSFVSCGCYTAYLNEQEEKCDCWEKFEKEGKCDCYGKFTEYRHKMTDEHRHDKKTEILMILDACPDSARRRDNDGNLPLHLAVANGKKWDGGVEALVEAYPEALEMRDPVHCLYPFMLAAQGEHLDLDVSFELLRAGPGCLVSLMPGAQAMQAEPRGEKRKLSSM